MMADAHAALPARPDTTTTPIFGVDPEWFAEDGKARDAGAAQEREPAAERGISAVEPSLREPVPTAPAPASDLPFDFGLDDLIFGGGPEEPNPVPDLPSAQPPAGPPPVAAAPVAAAPIAPATVAHLEADLSAHFRPLTPLPPTPPDPAGSVADDFAALLALEIGAAVPEPDPLPVIAPAAVGVQVVTPAITEAMLDQIAHRVAERLRSSAVGTQPGQAAHPVPPPQITDAMLQQIAQQVTDRLKSGIFSAQLRDAVAATVRDTVRSVVSDTSERLVREEIARIKSKTQT